MSESQVLDKADALDEDDGILEFDGIDSVGPEKLPFFKGEQDRKYLVGFIWHEVSAASLKKKYLEDSSFKTKVTNGQVKIVEKEDGKYVRRPRFFSVNTHWSEETSTFRCFKGLCCKEFGEPKTKIATLIVKYPTDNHGRPKKEKFDFEDLELYIFSFNEKLYNAIKTANEMYPLLNTDVVLTCTNEDYKTFTAQSAKESIWQNQCLSEMLKEVAPRWEEVKNRALAKRLTEDSLKEKLGIQDRAETFSADLNVDVNAQLDDILADV
jgi:hypothetical protein